jgi:hypothetical protein
MSSGSVTDETILAGFASLHQAMAEGFDRLDRKIDSKIDGLRGEMNLRFAEFEARMMRRFDERDVRLDDHEHRISRLEAQG